MKFTKILLTAIFAVALASGSGLAFHDAGVADCQGCHTMHNSQDGALVDAAHPNGNAYLLNNGNSTDTCLGCHAAYGQFFGGLGYGPGGDFYWLTKTFTWTSHGHANESTGDSHGHNVYGPAYGLTFDATLGSAPGGDFLSTNLTCTSCHDPHGNESFRLLYGSALGPIYGGTRYDFVSNAPIAAGNSRRTYVGGGGNETDARHTIHKSGMSLWCANCHETFHSPNTTKFVHPTGQNLGSTVAAVYNAYVSSEDQDGGVQATSYWGLVPFEAVNVDLETADPTDYTLGPAGTDRVMCVTCHRAHASAFPDAGRWDFGAAFINDESHPQDGDGGASVEDIANKYYQYTFTDNQRSLCNKCHVKDAFDHMPYPVGP
ncbi:MAG: hypothetical protein ABIK65_08995 [Candidatus Eisenbacteria bacterium]